MAEEYLFCDIDIDAASNGRLAERMDLELEQAEVEEREREQLLKSCPWRKHDRSMMRRMGHGDDAVLAQCCEELRIFGRFRRKAS